MGPLVGYSSGSLDSEQDDSSGPDDRGDASGGGGGLPPHIRARLESQSKYITQLEEQNLDLQEV